VKQWQETLEILHRLAALTAAGQQAAVACVVQIAGSAYRRPGARFLIAPDGSTLGGISGGCLEEDVRQTGLATMKTGHCRLLHYETGDDDDDQPSSGPQTYIVVAGDTASEIAERFGITVEELAAANGLTVTEANDLQVGQELSVPEAP